MLFLLFYNILSDCHYSDVLNILLNAFRLKKNFYKASVLNPFISLLSTYHDWYILGDFVKCGSWIKPKNVLLLWDNSVARLAWANSHLFKYFVWVWCHLSYLFSCLLFYTVDVENFSSWFSIINIRGFKVVIDSMLLSHVLRKAAKLPTFYLRKSQSCHFLRIIELSFLQHRWRCVFWQCLR